MQMTRQNMKRRWRTDKLQVMAAAIYHMTCWVRCGTKKFTHHSTKNILYDEILKKSQIHFEIIFLICIL